MPIFYDLNPFTFDEDLISCVKSSGLSYLEVMISVCLSISWRSAIDTGFFGLIFTYLVQDSSELKSESQLKTEDLLEMPYAKCGDPSCSWMGFVELSVGVFGVAILNTFLMGRRWFLARQSLAHLRDNPLLDEQAFRESRSTGLSGRMSRVMVALEWLPCTMAVTKAESLKVILEKSLDSKIAQGLSLFGIASAGVLVAAWISQFLGSERDCPLTKYTITISLFAVSWFVGQLYWRVFFLSLETFAHFRVLEILFYGLTALVVYRAYLKFGPEPIVLPDTQKRFHSFRRSVIAFGLYSGVIVLVSFSTYLISGPLLGLNNPVKRLVCALAALLLGSLISGFLTYFKGIDPETSTNLSKTIDLDTENFESSPYGVAVSPHPLKNTQAYILSYDLFSLIACFQAASGLYGIFYLVCAPFLGETVNFLYLFFFKLGFSGLLLALALVNS